MKCKVSEAPSSVGMGRPRTSIISAVHSSTRSSKVNNNDSNTVRRSSRRATIERRVWAVPKKGNKFACNDPTPSAKKKSSIQNKKDRKPSSSGKMEVRNASKSKGSHGSTKRGVSPSDETGHTRKKVKKKSHGEDVGASSKVEFSDIRDKSFIEMQGDQSFLNVSGSVLSDDSSSYDGECAKIDLKCEMLGNTVKGNSIDRDNNRTGGVHNESIEDDGEKGNTVVEPTSPVSFVDSNCDIGKEETMCIEDMCLHKAVIVEVVSDYDRSDVKQNYSPEMCLRDDESNHQMNHNMDETDSVISEGSFTLEETGPKLGDSTLFQDSGVAENKDESVGSPFSDTDKLLSKPEKSPCILEIEPSQNTGNVVTTVDDKNKDLCPNTTKVLASLDISGVTSVYDVSYDIGSDHTTSGVLVGHDSSSKVKSEIGVVEVSSVCNALTSSLNLDAPVIDNKDSCVAAKVDVMEPILNGDVLESEADREWNVLSKEPQGTVNSDLVQNGVGIKASLSEKDDDTQLEDLLGHSDVEVDGVCSQDCTEQQQPVDSQQCNSEFDPGGNNERKCLVSPNHKKSFDLKESTSPFSYDEFESDSCGDDDNEIVTDNVIAFTKPMELTPERGSDSEEGFESVHNEKDSSKEIIPQNCAELCSESMHKFGNACIPELNSNFRTLSSITQLCDQSENQEVPLRLIEDADSEDHVSLSVALAQLVDAGCADEVEGAETLTIHSAAAIAQVNEERKGTVTSDTDLEDQVKREQVNDDDPEEEEGKLFIKEEDEEGCKYEDEEEEEDDEEIETKEEEEVIELEEQVTPKTRNVEDDDDEVEMTSDTRQEEYASSEKVVEVEEEEVQPLNLQKTKKQLPPLIKISTRPPTIKTPLKCPECPMQFCTVRSLFWHFGLHGARSRETSLPPILLQDLIVPWDKPSISLFLSQAQDLLEKAEKSVQTRGGDKANDAEKTVGGIDTLDPMSPLVSTTSTASMPIVSTVSLAQSSSDIPEKDQTAPLHLVRTDDSSGSNGDVILKIPIPRLKRKLQASQPVKMDKFVNILPKLPGHKRLISRSARGSPRPNLISRSTSPPPQVTLQPSAPLDLVTVTPQPPLMPQLTVMPNSNSRVQIQPLTSSSGIVPSRPILSTQPVVSSQSLISSHSLLSNQLASSLGLSVSPIMTNTKTTSSTPSHITFIPMDNIPTVNANPPQGSKLNPAPVRMIAPSQLPSPIVPTPVDGLVEKDGLVMINSNLALRIVSSLPSTLDTSTNTTNTTTIHPITNPSINNLTILPQMEGSRGFSSIRESMKNPDILTIVPQVDLSKRLSLLKNSTSVSSSPASSGTQTSSSTAGSQVVKLYLLQSKESSSQNTPKVNMIPEAFKNLNGVEFKPLSILNGKPKDNGTDEDEGMSEEEEDDDDEEDDERSMVIADIKEEVEEDLMDPLSLCAVTMEDEHLELSNHATSVSQSNVHVTSAESDKEKSEKVEVKVRGKKEKLDIVKYEARKYVCCYCNRRFGWSTDLKRHVILHTGERPFQCKVCPTAFTRKFLLQNHMKRMHPDKCKMSDLWP